ncbi:MAG: S8 family serine peptidase [Firmicutes bacterium]|nr:S8 family serine peptidase [Bacillota bacterium]
MKAILRKRTVLLTCLCLCIAGLMMTVQAAGTDEESVYLDPLTFEQGEQILPVTIDPADGTAVVDGGASKEAIKDVYALSKKESRQLTSGSKAQNKEAILEYLLQDPCIVHEQKDGTLRAAYPFAMKTLIVLLEEGQLEDTFGAVDVIYDSDDGTYYLQYASQEDTAAAYAALAEVWGKENVLIDLPASPNADKYDPSTGDQTFSSYTTNKSLSWGVDVMYMDKLRDWCAQNPASGTLKVAVIDTGIRVDETTEKIIDGYGIDASRILTGSCASISSSIYNYSALLDQSDSGWQPKTCQYADLKGHGTHVMSTVMDGTPSQVKVFALRSNSKNRKVDSPSYYSNLDIVSIVKAVEQAGARGAKVANISLAVNCYDYATGDTRGYYGKGITSLDDITEDTFFYYSNELSKAIAKYDLCLVASAGNDGDDSTKRWHFPSSISSVIEVSNLKLSSGNFGLSSSSNYGSNVSFCAPGTNIVGAGYDWDTHKACYTTMSGTSMASPHITAALATLRLYYPDLDNKGAVDLLKKVCKDLGDTGWDEKFGYGMPQFKTQCNMVFNYNNSVTPNLTVTVPKGMPLKKPATPSKEGHEFGGWYQDKNLTQPYEFGKPVLGSSNLYAKWDKIHYQIKFDYQGHGYTNDYTFVAWNEYLLPPMLPTDFGWKFCGWYLESSCVTRYYFDEPVKSAFTLYGKWEKINIDDITPTDEAADDAPYLSLVGDITDLYTYPDTSTNTMTITWTDVGAVNYRVLYRNAVDYDWIYDWTAGYSYYELNGLKLNSCYDFRICAFAYDSYNQWIRGDYTPIQRVWFKPAKSFKVKAKKKAIRVTWKKISGANGYQVLYSTSPYMDNAKVVNVKGGSKKAKTIKKLKKNKRYYVQVRGYKNKYGSKYLGNQSKIKSAKVK